LINFETKYKINAIKKATNKYKSFEIKANPYANTIEISKLSNESDMFSKLEFRK